MRPKPQQLIMHIVNLVGDSLDLRTASAFVSNMLESKEIDEKTAGLIITAIGNNALSPIPPEHRNRIRASIFKQLLVSIVQ